MMKSNHSKNRIKVKFLLLLVSLLLCNMAIAKQEESGVSYERVGLSDGTIKVTKITNKTGQKIEISYDGGEYISCPDKELPFNPPIIVKNNLSYKIKGKEKVIWEYNGAPDASSKKEETSGGEVSIPSDETKSITATPEAPIKDTPKEEIKEVAKEEIKETPKEAPKEVKTEAKPESKAEVQAEPKPEAKPAPTAQEIKKAVEEAISVDAAPMVINIPDATTQEAKSLMETINNDEYFGIEATDSFLKLIKTYSDGYDKAADKKQFLVNNGIEAFIASSLEEIESRRKMVGVYAQDMVQGANIDGKNQEIVMQSVVETLQNQLDKRSNALQALKSQVTDAPAEQAAPAEKGGSNAIWIVLISILGAAIVILIIVILVKKKKATESNKSAYTNPSRGSRGASVAPALAPGKNGGGGSDPGIVVRRRTTSILKKQNIDDVRDNPDYLKIDSAEFVADSAVRNIYIKNSCIRDVYNMYAEDLRNSANPKEDGCMVIGRWVQDPATRTYDVSLEEVVYPGDDAVFKEYELNFGGKIKLRVAERLRVLRKETNLQYDLVCWIHSHPGLGVFFSNSDDTVQSQLKHAQHPNFLVAFVVDILTADQEMGIFTYRHDGSMNSGSDLTKKYSLDELHKWALQSERNMFNPENYFNLLSNAKTTNPLCRGISLNNNAIIDMLQIIDNPDTKGLVGWVSGNHIDDGGNRNYVVSKITETIETRAGVIGCLVKTTHVSIPSIQKLITADAPAIRFVMVYSSRLASVTTIPVINGQLVMDEQYYGDSQIEELKTWTRRRR